MDAFEVALKYGAEFIEFDVRKLKDGNIIVFHDENLDRTTNSSGFVKNFTYPEIKSLKTKITGSQIPLLSEVLDSLKGKGKFMIELKDEGIFEDIIKLIHEFRLLDDCIFSGRNFTELKALKERMPEIRVCYNITKGKGLSLSEFFRFVESNKLNFKPDLISLKSSKINSKFIEVCHIHDITALTWDFYKYPNPIEKIKNMILLGIDGILFDNYRNIPLIKDWIKEKLFK
jgi:glycerophosphoryl diester phosphodiesterase